MSETPTLKTVADEVPDKPVDVIMRPLQRFLRYEASGGIVLIVCTIVALAWANSSFAPSYLHLFGEELKVGISAGDWSLKKSLLHFINDALMAVFFLMVGLEVKRELLVGELNSPRRAALPMAAAAGGMVVPALIYVLFNLGEPSIRGWGVPMATDIAFAIGMLALLGSRVPLALRAFLASLAIVDDIGALLIIAIFYTSKLDMTMLAAAGGLIGVLAILNAIGVRRLLPYLIIGVFLWYVVLKSGVHATIAGVIVAAAIPVTGLVDTGRFSNATRRRLETFDNGTPGQRAETSVEQRAAIMSIDENCRHVLPPLHRLEYAILPWVAFLIVPIFALANAGVPLPSDLGKFTGPLPLGIILGLLVGKPVGVLLFSWLSVKAGIATLPKGVTWRHITGAGLLAGIGFTMAIFIANLAFLDPPALASAKAAILSASAIATIAGLAALRFWAPDRRGETDTTD